MPLAVFVSTADDGDIDEGGKKRTRDMEIGNMRRILSPTSCKRWF
ncbi:hypothetical protein AP1_0470 [Aeromonas phage AP1]|nr:hypothetical protein AP1_0470 [Aeromonas phage AP1]